MVLLVMIALAMLSLSTIEVRASRQSDSMAVAQANARLALMIAIGNLQKETGHDQTITAPAGALTAQGFAAIDTHETKQHYLMAFDTKNPSTQWAGSRSAAFRRYLVSGDDKDITSISYASQAILDGPDTVSMTGQSTLAEHQVNVPIVAVTDSKGTRSGSYGWWINGQGSRASAALTKRSEVESEHTSPDRFNIRAVGNGDLDWVPDRDQPDTLAKVVSTKTLEILSPDGQGLNDYQHWISANNRALLVNPTTGTFKKDLTAAFDGNTSSTSITDTLGERMFPPAAGGNEGDMKDPGGPKWKQAQSYYQLHNSSGLDVRPQTEAQMGVYPVIAGFTEFYGASNTFGYSPAASETYLPASWFNRQNGTPNWVMTMHMSPVIKLWNPYNKPLNSSSYTIAVRNADHQYAGETPAARHADESRLVWANVRPSFLPMGIRFEHRYTIPAVTFSPGEVKVFSLRKNHFMDSYKKGAYAPGPGGYGTVGTQVDIIGKGYILGELAEGPFTGHTFWDMHCTTGDASEYDAENDPDNYYITGRATGGWTARRGRIATDGSKTVISDSRNNNKTFLISSGDLTTWSLELYQGKVTKSQTTSTAVRPLVSIKNINTAANNAVKRDPNLNESFNLHNNAPYFTDANLDGIWARSISMRMAENNGDQDATVLNPAAHGTKDVKWLGDFNPRSPTIGCWPEEYSKKSNPYYSGKNITLDGARTGGDGHGLGTPGNYLSGILINMTSLDDAMPQPFIGYSDIGGTDRCVLFDIPEISNPEAYFVSVGQLRHANLTIENGNYTNQLTDGYGMEDFFSDNMRPAYAIGESLADIRLKPNVNNGKYRTMSIVDGKGSYESTHYDFSWHMNQLWDSAFFSARKAADQGKSSHNARLTVLSPDQPLKTGEDGIKFNASRVFLEGAFNVNSTSPEAWAAFLTATIGAEVSGTSDASRAPFARVSNPQDGMTTETASEQDAENYSGFRGLSSTEIELLSQGIVEQVKRRGPFLSLADFVNRATQDGAPDEITSMGALQSAINIAGLNKHLSSEKTTIDAGDVGAIYNQDAYAGDVAHAIPGYLTQGDILARMGHLLTTRSDTFTIRAYGEARDANGRITARTWCEAQVQRYPEYLDTSDELVTAHKDLTSNANKTFGRKYHITSFRWIPTGEIQ